MENQEKIKGKKVRKKKRERGWNGRIEIKDN